MTTFGETEVAEIITTLAKVSSNVVANNNIEQITKEATSCIQWAEVLESLMQDTSVVYVPKSKVKIDPKVFDEIARKLNDGKTILMTLNLTKGGNHAFAIEPLGGGKARILHGWQNCHQLRSEPSMPIEELCDTLKSLTNLEHKQDVEPRGLKKAFCKLFGEDHAQLGNNPRRSKTSITSIIEGVPRESLTSPANRARLRGLSEIIAPPEMARLSGSSGSSGIIDSRGTSSSSVSRGTSVSSGISGISDSSGRNTVSTDDLAEAGGRRNRLSGVRMGIAVGAGLGFVLGVAGAWHAGEDWKDIGLAGLKDGLGGCVAGGVAAGVIKVTTPTFAGTGASIVRSNAAAGIALFGVYAIWDVTEWKMHKITDVGLRKRLAEGAGAAGGGLLGGAAAGVAGGAWLGPIGAGVGGIIGGVVGGIGGKYAAKGIDYMIWDQGEDAIMNSYEFFGWHDVDRNTRPIKTPKEMGEAYAEKLENIPKKMDMKDWNNICLGTFMVLAQGMYPFFQDLLKLANKVRENHSNGLSVIATLVMEQSQIEEE